MENNFCKNLKFLRSKYGISQQYIADKIEVDRSTIGYWENNKAEPTMSNILKLAEVLKVSVPELIGKDLSISNELENNKYDKKIKELETETGVKISYSTDKELTQEDYLAINQLVLDEMKAQEEENK